MTGGLTRPVEAASLPERYLRLVLRTLGASEDDRLHGIRGCVEGVLEHGIPGDFIVTGSRQGTATVFARALLAASRVADRWVWVASPQGDWHDLDAVRAAFAACELLDESVRFIEGPMWNAVPVAPIDRLAVMHLDAGTGDAVEHLLGNLYPRLAIGGFVVVDEYETSFACRDAADRFRRVNHIADDLRALGSGCVAWRKEAA